jgi:hypothetical protein
MNKKAFRFAAIRKAGKIITLMKAGRAKRVEAELSLASRNLTAMAMSMLQVQEFQAAHVQ